MPRTPLVAVRTALRSAVQANGEAGHGPSRAIEGHGPAQAMAGAQTDVSRACGGARATQRAFTICDVTPVDNSAATRHQ